MTDTSIDSRRYRTRYQHWFVCCLSLWFGPAGLSQGGDWNRFLGPGGTAASDEVVVDQWSDTENVLWKSALPGIGVSSPIVVAGKVFVTGYSGYGTGADGEEMENLKRHLTCFDAKTGSQVWSKTIDAVLPEDPYRPPGVTSHGYASHTPVSDGQHVFAFFGKTGVIAFDMDGNEKWRKSVGTGSGQQRWGSSSSPILFQTDDKKLVIVPATEESESIVAFDSETGKEIWKSEAEYFAGTWSTPALVKAGDRTDLVIMVPGEVWGLNPETGKLRWYSPGTQDSSTAASPAVVGDTVYAVGGRGGAAVAVRAGGKGDVADSHVVWEANIQGRFSSPVAHEGHLYVYNEGVLSVYDATSGERVKQQRLSQSGGGNRGGAGRGGRGGGGRGGFGGRRSDYATPVVAGGKLYIASTGGEFYVVSATPELEVIATNKLTDETGFSATPAISEGRLYLRSGGFVYCIGKEST